MASKESIPIASVRTDGTQCRVETYDVSEMVADIREEGSVRTPIVVFFDGEHYWAGDGHHRVKATKEAGAETINALVHQGTQRDALLYATGANAEHGHQRTNADKRNAVLTLLRDPEWSQWSDREIARRARVDNRFVGNVRRELLPSVDGPQIETTRKVQRGDAVYEQDTSNIGKSKPAQRKPAGNPAIAAVTEKLTAAVSPDELSSAYGLAAKLAGEGKLSEVELDGVQDLYLSRKSEIETQSEPPPQQSPATQIDAPIVVATPVVKAVISDDSANDAPGDDEIEFDGSYELIEIQDRFSRIKRSGTPRDLRNAARICEKWLQVFQEASDVKATA